MERARTLPPFEPGTIQEHLRPCSNLAVAANGENQWPVSIPGKVGHLESMPSTFGLDRSSRQFLLARLDLQHGWSHERRWLLELDDQVEPTAARHHRNRNAFSGRQDPATSISRALPS